MPNVGDKYIIEISEVYGCELIDGTVKVEEGLADTMYHIRGTRLIFDEEELSKLEEYTPETSYHSAYQAGYEDGLEKAWGTAKQIVGEGELPLKALDKMFGTRLYDNIFCQNTPAEAIAKIMKCEDKKAADDEIKVGDELQNSQTNEKGIVVFFKDLCSYPTYCLFGNAGIFSIEGENRKYWQKTGHHFPQIAELLKEMGENDE